MRSESPHPDPLGLAGTVLDKRYRIDEPIARGGFATVFSGFHLGLDTPVAIKVLDLPRRTDAEAVSLLVTAFLQEARTVAKLRHPHVVRVFDSGLINQGSNQDVPYIVLEWLEGQTLRDFLLARRGDGGVGIEPGYELLRPVIEAVAEAHAAGIAHRDLKPSNIMLVQTPRGVSPRVLDFGISKLMEGEEDSSSGHTSTGGDFVAFSRNYAAPEQLSRARSGPWTDVHALALIFTELLVGDSPYPAQEPDDIYRLVFDEKRPSPSAFGVDVGSLEAILVRALALKAKDRFQDAGELLFALDEALGRPPGLSPTKLGTPAKPNNAAELEEQETLGPTSVTSANLLAPAGGANDVEPNRKRWPLVALALGGAGLGAALLLTQRPSAEAPNTTPSSPLESTAAQTASGADRTALVAPAPVVESTAPAKASAAAVPSTTPSATARARPSPAPLPQRAPAPAPEPSAPVVTTPGVPGEYRLQ